MTTPFRRNRTPEELEGDYYIARPGAKRYTESVQFKITSEQLQALYTIRDTTKVPMAALFREAIDMWLQKANNRGAK